MTLTGEGEGGAEVEVKEEEEGRVGEPVRELLLLLLLLLFSDWESPPCSWSCSSCPCVLPLLLSPSILSTPIWGECKGEIAGEISELWISLPSAVPTSPACSEKLSADKEEELWTLSCCICCCCESSLWSSSSCSWGRWEGIGETAGELLAEREWEEGGGGENDVAGGGGVLLLSKTDLSLADLVYLNNKLINE